MTEKLFEIKIKELDDTASGPSGKGALLRIVLRLSQRAPAPWADYFNQAWSHHIYMMKRRAFVSGDQLEIVCMPAELETDHIPELNKIIEETNKAYQRYLTERDRARQIEEERVNQERKELSALKGRLKFD